MPNLKSTSACRGKLIKITHTLKKHTNHKKITKNKKYTQTHFHRSFGNFAGSVAVSLRCAII